MYISKLKAQVLNAVHNFLSANKYPERIFQLNSNIAIY